jgi:hypothetical protein
MVIVYRPAKLHRLADLIPWNLFLGSLNVYKFGLRLLKLRYASGLPLVYRRRHLNAQSEDGSFHSLAS